MNYKNCLLNCKLLFCLKLIKMIFILPTDTCYWIGCYCDNIEDYKKIYKIKNRSFSKPLAIFLNNYKEIEKYAYLSEKQLDFIKKYKHPFTVLLNIKNNLLIKNLPNKDKYKKIAFRIADNNVLKSYTKNKPIFLTSANFSWETEIYNTDELKKQFKNYLEEIEIDETIEKIEKKPPSNIFEFINNDEENIEIKYLRKNY